MMHTESTLLDLLDRNGIAYSRSEHPPVYTCEEADRFRPELPGVHTKNLFLRDEGGKRFFLVVTLCEKRVDSKALGRLIGARKLHFGSPEELYALLGLTPGAVTVLGLANDAEQRVELIFDAEIWVADAFLCHPLVNTATLVMQRADLMKFLDLVGHSARVENVPARP